jgi:hypothetical protein
MSAPGGRTLKHVSVSAVKTGQWQRIRMLVTVKAYPSISTKYGEAICVAGVRLDTPTPQWARLFPVRFRDLPFEQRFAKYEVIELEACQHSTDKRVETWRPNVDTIVRVGKVPAGGIWAQRRAHLEPLMGPTMCGLHRGRKGGTDGPSLGLIRPTRVRGIKVSEEPAWSEGQRGTVGQGNLLTEKTELVKAGHAFSYSYVCEEPGCKGHEQKIVDWELGEAYRSWSETGDDLIAAIKRRWRDDMCAEHREPLFFVGDQHRFPGQFLVLGTFYPERRPDANQLSFELAA